MRSRIPPFVLVLAGLVSGLTFGLGWPLRAQVTVPFSTFTAGTTIDPDQMNSNFSALSLQALNRTGGTITGNIAASSNITIDGADISDYLDGSGNLTVTGTATVTGALTGNGGGVLTNSELKNYRETSAAASISSGTLALDLANGNHFQVPLNANITTFTVANCPASGKATGFVVLFTADGTLRTITWPTTTKWSGGVAPTMTSTNGKIDLITLYSVDGCTTFYGINGGQSF
jgi:hypothetical protein